ncbi:MAG: hypothetical protein ABI222_12725 [Opitutaceae bacterium]
MSRSRAIGQVVRPAVGWIRTVRGALAISLTDLARRLKVTPPAVRSFELAEAEDRITLASLRRTAAAMDCELVYALVPRTSTPATVVEAGSRAISPTPVDQTETLADPDARKVTDRTWRTLYGDD